MTSTAYALDIQTPLVFEPLLRPARFKGVHGGRGSGKSHFFAEEMIDLAVRKSPLWAVCLREVQNDLDQSVKKLLEAKIIKFGLQDKFRVLKNQIVTPGGGLIIFRGMNDYTADSIKSLEGYEIGWFEEAQTLTARSLEMLRPTIRSDGSELWFSWNPRRKSDPIDMFFRGPNPPEDDMIVVEANWRDNPFITSTLLGERNLDKRNNPDRYGHIWEGEYEPQAIGAIFSRQLFDEHRIATLEEVKAITDIERIVVAVDHATSSNPGSDEHGIQVMARGADNRGYHLEDASTKGTPQQWARRVLEKFDQYGADAIVIERNQGGDLVRHNLETERSGLPIVEVTATKGKHVRAEPVSARYSQGSISHVGKPQKLEDQMVLITAGGYEGEGSPDRADAYVWAITELFPTMGDGHVFPIPESDIRCAPFQIPSYWMRGFAIDTDSRASGVIWVAIDPHTDTHYVYAEHYQGHAVDVSVHARAIEVRGPWMRGIINPFAHGRRRDEGEALIAEYQTQGVSVIEAPDHGETSIQGVLDRMTTGRFKVFSTCTSWFREVRVYHRDKNKEIVDKDNRLMNATRHWVMNGKYVARVQPRDDHSIQPIRAGDRRAGY